MIKIKKNLNNKKNFNKIAYIVKFKKKINT